MLRVLEFALYGPYSLVYAAPMSQDTVQDGTGRWSGKVSGNAATVYEAAQVLGITVDAIRKRIQRGTIPHERREDGRVYVFLDAASTLQDKDGDGYWTERDTLVESLREQVEYLKGIVATRDEEVRRRDHIIAGLVKRVPALEAPSEPRGGPETATEGQGEGDGHEGPQTGSERSWWRRMFG